MAIYTDFFVASEKELREAFPHRFPVADRPVEREVRNPFTGQMQIAKEWRPAKPFPKSAKVTAYPTREELDAVRRFPSAQWKGVDQVKLATLQQLLTGREFGSVEEFKSVFDPLCRPALLAPGAENSQLIRLPASWIEAVAGIEKITPLAKKWAATEECRLDNWTVKDASEVIRSLRELAKRVVAEAKGMFVWVNL